MSHCKDDRLNLSLVLLSAAALLAGCETAPTALESNFGSSVRAMIEHQTAEPGYAGQGLDGRKSEEAWKRYREDVAQPKDAEQEIIRIQMGK